jgi:glycerol uptake facilitator-like aquaporin
MLTGDVSLPTGLLYFLSQFLGAVFGAAILWGCTASQLLMEVSSTTGEENATSPPYLLGSNFVNPAVPLGSAFLLEVMGTFLLVWTVLNTAVSKHSIAANLAPMAIGFSVFLAHIVLIPFTGCGINPARTFGPHMVILMAGETVGKAGWWIYYTAPFVGAGAAALVCKYLLHLKPVVPSVEDKEGEFMEHKKTKAAKHTSYKGENSNSVVEANNTMDHSSAEFKI